MKYIKLKEKTKEELFDIADQLRYDVLIKDKEIERLKNELEVSRNNEETYRLEMLDITKRLGLDEETLFDDVKDKVERLNNIINELEEWLKDYISLFDKPDMLEEQTLEDLKEVLNKLQELKGEDKE